MHSTKFIIFGWEIIVRPESSTKLHISDNMKEIQKVKPYEFKFDMKKRIDSMVGNKQHIDYTFRNLDIALLSDRKYVNALLIEVLGSLTKIRNTLKEKGATPEQLSKYDSKVYLCFERTVKTIRHRSEYEGNYYISEDKELLEWLMSCDIKKYYNFGEQIDEGNRKDNNSR